MLPERSVARLLFLSDHGFCSCLTNHSDVDSAKTLANTLTNEKTRQHVEIARDYSGPCMVEFGHPPRTIGWSVANGLQSSGPIGAREMKDVFM